MASPENPNEPRRGGLDGEALSVMEPVRGLLHVGRRFYAAPRGQARVRRATDIILLAGTLLALAGIIAAQPPRPLEVALLEFVRTFPGWLAPLWAFMIGLLALWTVIVLVAPLFSRRPRITLEALLAVVLAAALAVLSSRIASGHWPGAEEWTGISNHLRFPATRLSVAAAVVCIANAHLSRTFIHCGRWVLMLGAAGAVLQGKTTVGGTLAAVLIGIAAGAAVRLALGTSAGLPSIADIAEALSNLGVSAHGLDADERQSAGIFRAHATEAGGGSLAVKVYGRDAYDNQMLAKFWRTLWYRDGGGAHGLNRAQGPEREALLTLLAAHAGAPTAEVVTVGATRADDSLLVLRVSGQTLESLAPEEVDDDLLAAQWTALGELAGANVAHGQISPSVLRVSDGAVAFVDLGSGIVAPSLDERMSDRAQLLGTTAAVAGTERAVAAAAASLGTAEVAALLPYLQQAAFGQVLRRAIKAAGIDVDDLREAAAGATDAPKPELAKLRRVTWGTMLQLGLLVLAAYAVLSFFSGVDFGDLRDDLRDASWPWLVAAAIVAQLPRVTQAVSTRGAIPAQLPFGPVYVMQLAMSYMNLALPSSFARMAVSVRFFQRQGVPPASAITSGTIDSFTNTVVQAVLLVLLLLFSSASLNLNIDAPDATGVIRIAVLLIALALAVIAGVALSKRARGWIREKVATWWPQVRGTFRSLRGSHKLAQLFGGNIGTEVLFATALGLFARGLGFPLSLADLLVINISVSLLATVIPVPGGIGVVEGGLVVGLTAAGVPESAAFATALLYRIATFYLPPIWGWFALQWLRKNRYL